MSLFDGFWFWVGKELAEFAMFVGTILLIGVVIVIVALMQGLCEKKNINHE